MTVPAFRCYLCGSTKARPIVSGVRSTARPAISANVYACTNRVPMHALSVVECAQCRLRALFPAGPPNEAEQAYEAVEDLEYLRIEPHRSVAFQALVRRLRQWSSPPGRLLDVGCYTGLFVDAALADGWDAHGLEPSRWAAERAAERAPSRITQGFLWRAPFAPASFDVITSWDVIEHLADPKADLERMVNLLRPGGWLFLSTMASEALLPRLMGRRWPWYMEMHRFYFTPHTLTKLCAAVGFHVRAVAPYAHSTNLRYVLWKLEPHFGPLARGLLRLATATGLAERTLTVDLGDCFMAAIQAPGLAATPAVRQRAYASSTQSADGQGREGS